MKVKINVVGVLDDQGRTHPDMEWPEGWPPPQEGQQVYSEALGIYLVVRTVVWYPEGSEESKEPFVYVVIGRPRP